MTKAKLTILIFLGNFLTPVRAAEDELMTVAAERDRLAPVAEEARWRARQLERQLTDSQAAAETAQAVRAGMMMPPMSSRCSAEAYSRSFHGQTAANLQGVYKHCYGAHNNQR